MSVVEEAIDDIVDTGRPRGSVFQTLDTSPPGKVWLGRVVEHIPGGVLRTENGIEARPLSLIW